MHGALNRLHTSACTFSCGRTCKGNLQLTNLAKTCSASLRAQALINTTSHLQDTGCQVVPAVNIPTTKTSRYCQAARKMNDANGTTSEESWLVMVMASPQHKTSSTLLAIFTHLKKQDEERRRTANVSKEYTVEAGAMLQRPVLTLPASQSICQQLPHMCDTCRTSLPHVLVVDEGSGLAELLYRAPAS